MTSYAKMPDGLILPETLARSIINENLFGNRGAYRTASPTNKNTVGWVTRTGSADADTLADLPTLRSQSSDLIRNEALASGAINTVVTASVCTGVVPQSRIDFEFLGITEEHAAKWQDRADRIFGLYADSKLFDAERRANFWQMQEIVQRSKLEKGDVFPVRRYLPRPGALLGTAWQVVEAERVSTPTGAEYQQKDIRAGVELDQETGAPVAYHIAQVHPSEVRRYDDSKHVRVPAYDEAGNPQVLHVARRLRASQTRGVPYLAPVIELLKQLGRYTEAEITAAVISGFLSVVVTSPAAGTPGSPAAGMQYGGLPGQVGAPKPPASNKAMKLQSGIIMDLAPGEEIKVIDATRPNTAFDPFVLALLRQIGSALEIPFEVLVKHFTASYSASRGALIEAWRLFLKERDHLVTEFCRPVREAAIAEAIALGLLEAPGFFDDPLKREAWLGAEWVGVGMPQIDPLKEANAAKEWNALNVLSLQDIANQQNRDFDRTVRQCARERKLIGKIMPAAPAPAAADTANTPANERIGNAAQAINDLVDDGRIESSAGSEVLLALGVLQ